MGWLRHLRPRASWGSWSGPALPDDDSPHGDEASGRCFAFQLFGILIEIGIGRVRAVGGTKR